MLCCLYKEKRINAISIAEESVYEFRKEIKLQSAIKNLICEDCGRPVFLRICKNKQSHFAHWRGLDEKCPYEGFSSQETIEHKKCKVLLYHFLKKHYPDENIQIEYKAIPSRRSDLFIEFKTGEKLAIDIHRGNISATKWDTKHNDYLNAGIVDIWVIMGLPSSNSERNLPFFQQIMINESMNNTAIYIQSKKEELTLLKNIMYVNPFSNKEISVLFEKTYPFEEIKIMPNGFLDCDFYDCYDIERIEFLSQFQQTVTENLAYVTKSDQMQIDLNENLNSYDLKPRRTLLTSTKETPTKRKSNYRDYTFDKIKINGIMLAYLKRAINNETEYIEKLIEMIHRNANYYYLFIDIYKTMNLNKNSTESEMCEYVLKKAGLASE